MVSDIFLGAVLLSGLALLWLAGDKAVRYAVALTDIIGISSFAVGFVVMSISTGLPEIVTAILSSANGVAGLSAGNLFGAGLVNLTLVLGLSVLVAGTLTFNAEEEAVLLKMLMLVAAVASLVFFTQHLTLVHGAILLAAYTGAVYVLSRTDLLKKIMQEEASDTEKEREEELVWTGVLGTTAKFVGSLALVTLGAHITVEAAVLLAKRLGATVEFIGTTVVALGTTLPEITLELNAVKRREYALALGDIFGSTLVNLSLVLGTLSIVSPEGIHVQPLFNTILFFGAAAGCIYYIIKRHHEFKYRHGVFLIATCIAFFFVELLIAV